MKVKGLLVLVLFAFACGGDDGGPSQKPITPTPAMKDGAKDTVVSATKLTALKADPNSEDAMGAFGKIYADANQLVASVQQSAMTGKVVGGLGEATGAASDGCATVSGGTITYNNCTYGGTSVNGTISTNGDVITVDIVYDMSGGTGGVSSMKLDMEGSVTVTATNVDGTLKMTVNAETSQAGTVSSVTTIDYDAITLDASSCATAGTLKINSESGAMGYTYTTAVTVTFAPNCGDMTMTGGTDMPGMGG